MEYSKCSNHITQHNLNGAKRGTNGRQTTQQLFQNQGLERFLFFYVDCFVKIVKNGHGALVGITRVKGTSADTLFLLFEKRIG